MLADPNHARRPALPGSRRRLVAALLCAPLLLWPAFATVNPAAALTATPSATASSTTTARSAVDAAATEDTVALTLTPAGSSTLHLDQDLALSVTITNGTDTSIPAGTVNVYLAERALTTRSDLDEWLESDTADEDGELMTSVPLTTAVQPQSSVTVGITVPRAGLGLFEWSPWGPRGIAASLVTGDSVRATDQSTFVWYPDTSTVQAPVVTPVNLAVAMPITTPANSTGLISAEDLATYTAESGILTRQLDGVINRPVALAIDPMIIASIRVLGTSAPASAVDWLARLAQVENDTFPLGYADSDPSLAVQAGATGVLAPTSLSFATDPALFSPVESDVAATPPAEAVDPNIPVPTSTDAPVTEQPSSETVPTLEQLLAWDYTSTSIAWPSDNSVAQTDLSAFAAAGLTTTLLTEGNVSQDDTTLTANTTVDLGSGELGLVADTDISQAIRAAVTATSDDEWRGAMAEVSSQVAVVAAAHPDQARTLLATLDRGWPPTAVRLAQTIDALAALPWYAATTLTTAAAVPVTPDVTFESQSEPTESVDLANRLIEREAEVIDFSGALADPAAVTAPYRLALLAQLATSWQAEPAEWRSIVADTLTASNGVLHSVTVSTTGPINVVGSKVDIPVTLNNALGQAVTVRVQVVPSNGRLVVGNDVEAVLDASSAKTVSIPVTAAVGNGAVSLRVTLYTPAGTEMGQSSAIPVNVRADWEGIGSRIFAAMVVLFFGFGVWRNIVHRRRDRALAALSDADPDAGPPVDPDDLPAAPRG